MSDPFTLYRERASRASPDALPVPDDTGTGRMVLTATTRAGLRSVETGLGAVALDLSVPGRVVASAGGDAHGPPPLAVGGTTVDVRLVLAYDPAAARFSLVAEDVPLARDATDPGRRLPNATWMEAAARTLEAVEAYLDANPDVARVAGLVADRTRLGEIDETLAAVAGLVEDLRREREGLADRISTLRRGLVSGLRGEPSEG